MLPSFPRLPRAIPRENSTALFHARNEVLAFWRAEDEVDSKPRSLRKRIAEHCTRYRQSDAAILNRIPWRVGPRDQNHDEKSGREQDLDRDEVESIGADKVVGLAPLEKNAAVGTAFSHLEEPVEEVSLSAVGATQEQGPAKSSPWRLAGY